MILNQFTVGKKIHWPLLVFLVLFLNVKLVVKLLAILIIYCLQPDFRFGFNKKNLRLPLFYPLMIVLAIVNAILLGQFVQANYLVVLLFGIGFWAACILAVHQLKGIVESTDADILSQTIAIFFLLNVFVSLLQFGAIIWETGALNPFRYQGNYQKYFISTGDYIKGISFDTSTTNAILNAFGIIFFLYKRNWLLVLLCTATLLFTASNLVNILLFLTLLFLFIFHSSREQKSVIVICTAMLVLFMSKVSPQNNQYAANVLEKAFQIHESGKKEQERKLDIRQMPEDSLTADQRKEKIALLYLDSLRRVIAKREQKLPEKIAVVETAFHEEKPFIPQPSIHSAPFQNRDDTNAYRKELLQFAEQKKIEEKAEESYANTSLPGKAIACLQTGKYFLLHPYRLLTGAGLGNFSSKMAFKATALKFAGGFPQRLAYINPDFSANHLSLYTYFFSKRANAHSITNTPNSVYDQLIGEYGLLGLAAFFLFYVAFFARQYKKLTYGIPLLFLLLGFFFIDYWFEQLSIVILFELLLFLNLKETNPAL